MTLPLTAALSCFQFHHLHEYKNIKAVISKIERATNFLKIDLYPIEHLFNNVCSKFQLAGAIDKSITRVGG